MPVFEARIEIKSPLETVFGFLIQPEKVAALGPMEIPFRIISAPQELSMGSQFEFELTAAGLPQTFVHEIIEFIEPTRFVERQVRGPLGKFIHEHNFREAGDGVVEVHDRIEFAPPGGMAGFLVTEARIRQSLDQSIGHRLRQLKRVLEGTPA